MSPRYYLSGGRGGGGGGRKAGKRDRGATGIDAGREKKRDEISHSSNKPRAATPVAHTIATSLPSPLLEPKPLQGRCRVWGDIILPRLSTDQLCL